MGNKLIRLTNWSFEKDEKAKLIWIGEPFNQDKKWMVKVYFQSVIKRQTKIITVDWPTIHFLSVGRTYINGIVNRSQVEKDNKIINIDLSGVESFYNEREWYIQGTNEKGYSRTFSFKKGNKLYIVPCIEVIRGILGVDSFTLRLMLSMDEIYNYFTYSLENETLKLYFTDEYNKKLLTNEKIFHLAWILTNKAVLATFYEIYSNYTVGGNKKLKFNFKLDDMKVKARVKENENKIFIQELLEIKNKRIYAKRIEVEHPMLSTIRVADIPKKKEFITYTHQRHRDIQLESEIDGATKGLDLIDSNQITHAYKTYPALERIGLEKEYKRIIADENTERFFHDDRGKRTLSDIGGESKLKGLEFTKPENVQVTGELEEFVQVIRLLENKPGIEKIELLIDNLPVSNGGKFARLEDGITPRKYVLCKITVKGKGERAIIEVERQNRALSTLILKFIGKTAWKSICLELVSNLVRNSGSWDKYCIENFKKKGIDIIRQKHSCNNSYIRKRCEKIYTYIY